MTYPVDDKGNPRVDFVWGNMAMQPNDQRDTITAGPEVLIPGNIEGNRNWDTTYKYPSEALATSLTVGLSVGDQSEGNTNNPYMVNTRPVTIEADNHTVATTGYSNYPAYIPNYAGDGDTGLETAVPNLAGAPYSEWESIIEAAGFVYSSNVATTLGATLVNDGKLKSQTPSAGTIANIGSNVTTERYTAPTVPNLVGLNNPTAAEAALIGVSLVLGDTNGSTVGATALNNMKVKSQSIAAGAKVDSGTVVDIVVFDYVAPGPNTNVAGFSQNSFPGHAALTGTDIYMYLTGRTTKPAVGNVITVAGNTNSSLNRNYNVSVVEDNDSYNTGGTVVTLSAVDFGTPFVNPATNSGGTWIVA